MKALIFSLALGFSLLAASGDVSQTPATVSTNKATKGSSSFYTFPWQEKVSPWATPAVSPWKTPPEEVQAARLRRLLQELQNDIESARTALSGLNETGESAPVGAGVPEAPPPGNVEANPMPYTSANAMLPARDLSQLLSQDLSVNLGQNLAQNLAVPTSPPWVTWANGQGMILATIGGTPVAIPTYPQRTAWGNGPGVVLTTPGGAVYSIAPGYTQPTYSPYPSYPMQPTGAGSHDIARQLSIVQDDLDQILRYLPGK